MFDSMQTDSIKMTAPVTVPFLYHSSLPENPMDNNNNDDSIFKHKMPTKGKVEQAAYENVKNHFRVHKFDNLPPKERAIVEEWWNSAVKHYEKTVPHEDLTEEDVDFKNKCYSTGILA